MGMENNDNVVTSTALPTRWMFNKHECSSLSLTLVTFNSLELNVFK